VKGLFIGRFQPFHNGHLRFAQKILGECRSITFIVGSCQESYTFRNPFTASERARMIKSCFPDAEIIFIPDTNNDMDWLSLVLKHCTDFDRVYSNNPWTRNLFESKGFKVYGLERDGVSGTLIRRAMLKNEFWQDYVPKPVSEIIDEIKGVERIKTIKNT